MQRFIRRKGGDSSGILYVGLVCFHGEQARSLASDPLHNHVALLHGFPVLQVSIRAKGWPQFG
jgi:hypothetical protein